MLLGALASKNDFVAIWCEHHDDYLAEVCDGGYVAVQVKTDSSSNAVWHCADTGFVDAIQKFAEHETKYSSQIRGYVFFSNAKPYVPAATAENLATLKRSPVRLRDECLTAPNPSGLASPYSDAFKVLVGVLRAPEQIVFDVLRKLAFQQGPPLEGFREHLALVVGAVPGCEQLSLKRLYAARDELLLLVGKASALDVPSLDGFTSVLRSDGRPASSARSKRISVKEAELVVNQNPASVFRYAEVGGYLQLGKVSGQKDVLRQKMNAGYVGGYFDSIWLQAMAAESRLMERALEDPESMSRVLGQLEGVVLVECQNAEVQAALEPDERRRGIKIYQRILDRTEELARHDRANVENERAETLRGIAGLLSGSCRFAWGVPLHGGSDDGT
jgi:hypothetical protein